MKRKVIKQGHGTLTITLPSKWAKQFNLKSGDEVEISPKENGLYIATEKHEDDLKAEIDISGLDIPLIWKYFMAIYREGYDEVKVKFNPDELYDNPYKFYRRKAESEINNAKLSKRTPFEMIQHIIGRFIGYEIVEQHKDYYVIKVLSEPSSKEFETSLRRIFLLIQQFSDDLIESIKTNNIKNLLDAYDIDINIDKFHDYCIRVLNKTGFKEAKKSEILFATAYLLEMMGDEYKSISFLLQESFKNKNLKNLFYLGSKTAEQINDFYDLFYGFKKEKLLTISKRDQEIYLYLKRIYHKKNSDTQIPKFSAEELNALDHFRRISKYINELVELRIQMEY